LRTAILKFDIFNKKVTVRVSGIIIRDDTMLMIAHKKRGGVYWLLPGGGVKYGETLEQALRREFREELGIGVEVGGIEVISDSIEPRGRRHILNISFRCEHRDGELRLGHEGRLYDFGFFSGQEIVGMRIYPPINSTMTKILGNGEHELYLGGLWKE
jgi:8-oxo-dGTP diphosphatase